MPTGRTYTLLVTIAMVYFFANQTQVGWLFILTALLAGIVLAGWWFGRRMLHRVAGARVLTPDDDLYEGDSVQAALTLSNPHTAGVYQVRTAEVCPLAAPEQRRVEVFVPVIPPGSAVQFDYTVTVDRRGLHLFPPLLLTGSAPFGLFRRQRKLRVDTRVLVYPQVRRLSRLSLLDNRQAMLMARPRGGMGSEVLGTRPYRTGDSPRHLHWRSIARTGQLISKEFADEAQPGLTLALDVFNHPYAETDGKHTPFEWAVKVLVSVAEYARRRGYPLYLAVDGEALAAPQGTVAWDGLLQYLARVQPTGKRRLAEVLRAHSAQTLVAAVLPYPDPMAHEALVALHTSGHGVLAAVLDPATFPAGGVAARPFAAGLRAAGMDTHIIAYGDDWTETLVSQEAQYA